MIFGAIIGKIVGTRSPKKTELALRFVASEPVVLHVHGFVLIMDDVVISNTNYIGVITLDSRFGMRENHLDKVLTKLDHGFGADKEARNFGFGSRRHDKLDYLGNSEDRDISDRDRSFFREYYVGTRAAVGFADIKIGSI